MIKIHQENESESWTLESIFLRKMDLWWMKLRNLTLLYIIFTLSYNHHQIRSMLWLYLINSSTRYSSFELLFWNVHTMLCGRMQHTAALRRCNSCSAYAANASASTWKKNFWWTFFRLQKLWNETGELCLIFFSNWLIPFWNPYAAWLPLMGPTICRSNF